MITTGLLLLCICSAALAQTSFHSGWLASFNTIKLSGKWSLHADFQFRSTDSYAKWQTILLRTGINYQAGKRSIITAGYAYIPNRAGLSGQYGLLAEHRLWQQFIYNQALSKRISLQHRLRFEERWIPVPKIANGNLGSDDNIFATRLRYFFRTILPWHNDGKAFTKGFFTGIQNELFLHTSNKQKLNGRTFDQNRLYFSAGYRLSKQFDVEAGYLWQYSDRRQPSANSHNHVAQLAFYSRL